MAKAASRATSVTTLVVGQVEIPIGIFSAVDKPGDLAQFDTAGPNGGVLKAHAVARPVPVTDAAVGAPDVPTHSNDPLTDEPSIDVGPAIFASPAPVAGEYGRELVEEGSGVAVSPADVRRGVRLEDGRFIDCTDQLADIAAKTKLSRVEVLGFVDGTQVPRARVRGVQFIGASSPESPKGLRLLWEAMRAARRVAVVKITKRSRQTLGIIGPTGKTLMLFELVWAEDFREPPSQALVIQQAEVSASEVAMARDLVQAMAVPVSALDELRDDAIARREELKLAALAGEVPDVVAPPAAEGPQDVLAALEASLAAVS